MEGGREGDSERECISPRNPLMGLKAVPLLNREHQSIGAWSRPLETLRKRIACCHRHLYQLACDCIQPQNHKVEHLFAPGPKVSWLNATFSLIGQKRQCYTV